jgi:drug/metabolite transporter (DMT)-like permease
MVKKRERKRKRKRKKKLNISGILHPIMFFISIIFIIAGALGMTYSAYTYMIGFHNMDLAYNIAVLSNDVNINLNNTLINYRNLYDQYDFNKTASYPTFYLTAAKSMPRSLYMILLSSMLFMAGIFSSITLYGVRHDQ